MKRRARQSTSMKGVKSLESVKKTINSEYAKRLIEKIAEEDDCKRS